MNQPRVKLFYALGGFDTLRKAHKIFYDKIYAHPWLKTFFAGHPQEFIENQQTYFMAEKMGGPRQYQGKTPQYAHAHMYISGELFDIRQQLLRESLREADVEPELIEAWLNIDAAFRRAVTNPDMADFYREYTYKRRIIVPKPEGFDEQSPQPSVFSTSGQEDC